MTEEKEVKSHTRSFVVMRANGTLLAVAGLVFFLFSGLSLEVRLLGGGLFFLIGILAVILAGPFEKWERKHLPDAKKEV
jgi:hypothetical protein